MRRPGRRAGQPAAARRASSLRAQHALELGRSPARSLGVEADAGIETITIAPRRDRGPDHEPPDRIPFDVAVPGPARAREQREITEPPGRQADRRPGTRERERSAEERSARPRGRDERGDQAGQMAPADRRNHDRQRRQIERARPHGEPDATEANSSADAAPAAMPIRTICTIVSCPALLSG